MNDLMLDLETGALTPDAVIFSIGAVIFDRNTGETGKTLHVGLLSQSDRRVLDIPTMHWDRNRQLHATLASR